MTPPSPLFASAFRALVVAAVVLLAPTAFAGSVKTEHVEAELVAARTALVPGEPLTVALRLSMEKGWHTYWRNPGDSGLPTTLAWNLPAGVEAGPIAWGYGLRSAVRFIVWRLIRMGLLVWNLAETGQAGSGVLTRVFLISAVRG